VHGLDLPGAEQLVHQRASDAEPVSGLDDGQQEPLIALDRQVDDLPVRRWFPVSVATVSGLGRLAVR